MNGSGGAQRRETWRVIAFCIFLALVVLAVFGQTGWFDFVNFDDPLYVYENSTVAEGLSASAVKWAFTHAQVSNWIPLTTLSHMMDCQLFGLRAGGHHLVNVLWHAANAILLFLLLRQMTGSLWRSAFAAALFAVHPLRAESVAWVSERKDVLSGFFFLLTVWAYLQYVRKPSVIRYGAMSVVFILGLLAKSMVATLPFVLLLLDYWPLDRWHKGDFRALAAEKMPLLVIAIADCAATALAPGLLASHALPIHERLSNGLVSYVVYLWQMVFPANLAAEYPLLPGGPALWEAALAAFLLIAVSVVVWIWRKQHPFLFTGWLWYLGMLLPVVGLIQISTATAHADRYTYLPEIGLAIAATWAMAEWTAKWKRDNVFLGSLAVLGALAFSGYRQASYWRDSESVWSRALEVTSSHGGKDYNSVAHCGLGEALSARGQKDLALVEYRTAIAIDPGYKAARFNLGLTLFDSGKTDEAVAQFRTALEIDPDYAEARNGLGVALVAKGARKEAIAQYEKAVALKPEYADAHYNLGTALLQSGRVDAAISEYGVASAIAPGDARVLNNLGIALDIKGKTLAAIEQFRKALAVNPRYGDAHYDLGLALEKTGKQDEAIAEFGKALALNPHDLKVCFNLGKALVQKGDLSGALAFFPNIAAHSPDPLSQWFNLGSYFAQNGDFADATVCYRHVTAIDPDNSDAYFDLGLAFIKNKQFKEAIECWEQRIQSHSDQIDLETQLAWLLATLPDESLRNGTNAVALAEQANQSSHGHNPIILRSLAAAYAETGRYEEAVFAAGRALLSGPVSVDLTDKLSSDIKLYSARKPVREIPE